MAASIGTQQIRSPVRSRQACSVQGLKKCHGGLPIRDQSPGRTPKVDDALPIGQAEDAGRYLAVRHTAAWQRQALVIATEIGMSRCEAERPHRDLDAVQRDELGFQQTIVRGGCKQIWAKIQAMILLADGSPKRRSNPLSAY